MLAKPGDAFLTVTEGTVTEPIYFDLLLRDLQLSVVHIKVQPGNASDPRHVIRTAEREAKAQVRKAKKGVLGTNEPAKFDHVWVVDTDVAVRNHIWNDVHQLATAKKVTLAHSTPCFEFWLLLHLFCFTTRSVSVFLVNNRPPNTERHYRAFAFQTSLTLNSSKPFVARPDLRGTVTGELADEWDEQVADIQYRDVFEYAVGHGVSATGE